MSLSLSDKLGLGWLAGLSLWTLLVFGYDKWQAGRSGVQRVSESTLCLLSALGGWPGGLLAILLFRHKSVKASFQLKFAGAFFVWAGLVAGVLKLTGRI
jgi:uncharacterized membrane protein YsdA (DUF1294 family)